MDFPRTPALACEAPQELVEALGAFPALVREDRIRLFARI